tara:strand:+ start:34623 stop:36731 length:2109 start_codon:yes stop_codon:yes gene_type:complete
MAWSTEEFTRLGNLLTQLQDQGGPVDPESQEYKQVERLLRKLTQASTRSTVAGLTPEAILGDLERRSELAKKRGETYQSAKETKRQLLQYGQRTERIIREKIKVMYTSANSSQEEIKDLQEELKVLHKSNKENAAGIAGEEKGAQVAEQILQLTLGISKSSTDIMGSVKGFQKGLKKSLTASNLFATAAIRAFELFTAVDGATTGLFKKTGMTGYATRIVGTGKDLTLAFGAQAESVSADLFAEVASTRRSFGTMSKEEVDRMVVTAGKLSRLGVSVGAYVDLGTFMSKNLDQDLDAQEKTLGMLYGLGKQTKTSPEKMFREVATSLPVYSRYTKGFASVFAGIHLAAQRTNVDVSDLMTLAESLDSKDEALKQAQKFNALLGGQYLNPVELLAADPGEKVKLIAEAYQRANQSLGDVHPRVVRSLYQNFGLDAQQFKSVVNASFETYAAELSGVSKGTPELMKKVAEDIEQSKSAGEKMENAIALMFKKVFHGILPFVIDLTKDIVNIVKRVLKFAKFASGIGLAQYLFEEYVQKPVAARKKRKKAGALDASNIAVESENMLRKNPKSPLNNLLGSFRPLPGGMPMGRDDPEEIKVLEERNTEITERKEQRKRDKEARAMMVPGYGRPSPYGDSPVAMNTSSRATPSTQVPTVEGKFETSMQDDVLLSRLAKLRDKIHEYRTKTTKVSLNVGMNNIAEATV